jgi:IS30 family transposase
MISNLLNALVESGLTEAEIGKAIGRDQSSVNRLRRGKQRTDYETGVKIEQLHKERCPPPSAAPEQGRAAA